MAPIDDCPKCKKSVAGGKVILFNKIRYHKDCFGCIDCGTKQPKKFCEVEGRPYCQKCYREKVAPRCFGCQKVLEGSECVTILGHDYHSDCAKCAKCMETLKGNQYFPFKGLAYCFDCHIKVRKEAHTKRQEEMAKMPPMVKQPTGATSHKAGTSTSTTA